MKLFFQIGILLLSGIMTAQISGQLIRDGEEFPGAKISINNGNKITSSDFDGNFQIEIPQSLNKIVLVLNLNQGDTLSAYKDLTIIIKGIELSDLGKIDLGKIHLPSYKDLSVADYQKLNKSDKKESHPIRHYGNLLGYQYSNELSSDSIILMCSKENPISDFQFDRKSKKIIVTWASIEACKYTVYNNI